MTTRLAALLILCSVALVSTVGLATTLRITGGRLFTWSERVAAPAVPKQLEGSFHSSTPTVVLSWRGVANAVGYRVYRAAEGGDIEMIGDSDHESYEDTDSVQLGTEYRYFVTAVLANGLESQPSGDVYVLAAEPTETPIETPGQFSEADTPPTVVAAGERQASSEADEYQVSVSAAAWITQHTTTTYYLDAGSCGAVKEGAHWVATCTGTLAGCQGVLCSTTFRVCVFDHPATINWC